MLKSLVTLKDLIYPLFCISCNTPGKNICLPCTKRWLNQPKKSKITEVDLYFTTDYNIENSQIILAAKEIGNKSAINLLACSIATSINFAITDLKLNQPINLITIPSRPSAIRKRGRDHISELLAQVIKELSQINVQAYYQPILFIQKKIKDQSNLNSKARWKNIESAYRVNGSVISQSPTILVDDLITTGSSIQEALRALRDAKITIDAVITACAVGRNSLIR